MSTNKRKESAALFELIDKSTLKVPKSAGSLKIPNWWSSKTNPPPVPQTKPARMPQAAAPASQTTSATIPAPSPGATFPGTAAAPVGVAEAGAPVEETPVQHRLFDPPPPNVAPPTSPSIRPPMGGATPVHVAPAAVVPATDPAAKKAPPHSKPERGAEAPAAPPAKRVFAPQTYAQDRKAWSPPRPGAFARLPMWAIISGGAGLVILVCVIVIAAEGGRKTPPLGGEATATSSAGRALIPSTQTLAVGRGAASAPGPVPPGKVYEGGIVPHSPERYYIIVYSTPSQTVVQKNAEFLAAHGVDCSIERVGSGKDLMYMLVSVQGFASNNLAVPYQKKIQEIGGLLSPNGTNPFKDARPRNGLSSPGTPPARPGTR